MSERIEVCGQSIRYRRIGKGPSLMLLHTLRTQSEYFDRVIPELSRHFTVYSPDLPGHGESSKHETIRYDEPHFTGTIADFVEQLDLQDVVIAGESIGAAISLSLGVRIADRIRRIFAFNPYDGGQFIGGLGGWLVSTLGRYTTQVTSGERPAVLRKVLEGGFYNKGNLPDEFVELLFRTGKADKRFPAVMKSVYRNVGSWEAARQREYPKLEESLPVHLVYGDHDWAAEQIRQANLAAIRPVSELITLEKTGHFSCLDNPEKIVELIQTHTY